MAPPPFLTFSSSSLLSPKPLFLPSLPFPSPPSNPPPPFPSFKTLSSSSHHHHLLSTTEASDGSVLFRFGDDNELAQVQLQLQEKVHIISTSSNSKPQCSDDDGGSDGVDGVIDYSVLNPHSAATKGEPPVDSGKHVISSNADSEGEGPIQLPSHSNIQEPGVLVSEDASGETINGCDDHGDANIDDKDAVVVQSQPGFRSANAGHIVVDEDPTSNTVGNAPVGNHDIDNSKMLDSNMTSSVCEEEIAEADAERSCSGDMSIDNALESQIPGATRIREEISLASFLSSGAAFLPHPSEVSP